MRRKEKGRKERRKEERRDKKKDQPWASPSSREALAGLLGWAAWLGCLAGLRVWAAWLGPGPWV